MELEAGRRRVKRSIPSTLYIQRVVSGLHRPRVYPPSNIGKTKLKFISAYDFRLTYCQGRDNASADFLFRLLPPPTEDYISSSSTVSEPDVLGVYLIRAYGYITPSCPSPDGGPGELAPSPDNSSVLGGSPLTDDGFQMHRAAPPCVIDPA